MDHSKKYAYQLLSFRSADAAASAALADANAAAAFASQLSGHGLDAVRGVIDQKMHSRESGCRNVANVRLEFADSGSRLLAESLFGALGLIEAGICFSLSFLTGRKVE